MQMMEIIELFELKHDLRAYLSYRETASFSAMIHAH